MKRHVALLTIFALALAIGGFAQASPANLQITNGPRVEGTGSNWAVIAWTTNAGGSSVVRYGTDPNNLTQTAEGQYTGEHIHQGRVTHRVRINNLQPGMTYYFAAISNKGSGTGTSAMSSVGQFTTQGSTTASGAYQGAYPYQGAQTAGYGGPTQPIRIINGPRVEGAGNNWAVVAWTTNAGGSSVVRYGTNPNNLTQTAESPYTGAKVHQGEVTHRVRINNLQPHTTYYFVVDSGQGSGTGTTALSSVGQFTTR